MIAQTAPLTFKTSAINQSINLTLIRCLTFVAQQKSVCVIGRLSPTVRHVLSARILIQRLAQSTCFSRQNVTTLAYLKPSDPLLIYDALASPDEIIDRESDVTILTHVSIRVNSVSFLSRLTSGTFINGIFSRPQPQSGRAWNGLVPLVGFTASSCTLSTTPLKILSTFSH